MSLTRSIPRSTFPSSCAIWPTTPDYLLHRIIVGRVHQRRGNNLVPLKYDYLVKFIPEAHYLAIRDALIDSDVIHVRKFCVPGEIAYGFRLLYPHDQGFSHQAPADKRLINKIRAWRKAESRENPPASPPRLEDGTSRR